MIEYCECLTFLFPESLLTLIFVYMCINKHQLHSVECLDIILKNRAEMKCMELTNAFPLYPFPLNMK